MQRDPVVAHISELMRLGKMLSAKEIKDGKVRILVPSLSLPRCSRRPLAAETD